MAGRRFLAVLFSAAVLVAACGGTSTGSDDETECVALCEKGKAKGCNGASALNCEDNCLQEDARAETSGCRGTYNQTLACSSGLEDICTLIRDCREELLRHQACVDEYCSDHVADFCS